MDIPVDLDSADNAYDLPMDGRIDAAAPEPLELGDPNQEQTLIRQNVSQSDSKAAPASNASCFSLAYYQPFFDVDTDQEFERLLRTLKPWDTPFYRHGEKPDLYGPFWITTTLAFMMAAFGNFARFLSSESDAKENWHSDVQKISNAASGGYACLVIVPLILFGLIKYAGTSSQPSYIELMSVYGYSLFPYIPACILNVVPFGWFRWIVVIVAFCFSTAFLAKNVCIGELQNDNSKGLPIIGLIVCFHAALALLLRIYFFN